MKNIDSWERFRTIRIYVSQSVDHSFWFFAEWLVKMCASQFGNQCIIVWMMHNFTHRSFDELFPILFFVLFNFCTWKPWILKPIPGSIVISSATGPSILPSCWTRPSFWTCHAPSKTTFGSRRGDKWIFWCRISSVLVCTTFSGTVGWYRVVKDDSFGTWPKMQISSVLSTFQVDPIHCILVHFPHCSSFCGSFMGSTAVMNTVCHPSFVSFRPAIGPDLTVELRSWEESTIWFCRRFAPARCASFSFCDDGKGRRDCASSLYCTFLPVSQNQTATTPIHRATSSATIVEVSMSTQPPCDHSPVVLFALTHITESTQEFSSSL